MGFQAKSLSENVSVAPQIMLDDINSLKEAGFKSVINNRPDGEKPGQPSAEALKSLLEANGLNVRNIPMTPGQLTPEMVSQMIDAVENMPKPILAFCASGTRSTVLWCCAIVNEMGVDEALSAAANAGYDLEQIRPLLTQLSQ